MTMANNHERLFYCAVGVFLMVIIHLIVLYVPDLFPKINVVKQIVRKSTGGQMPHQEHMVLNTKKVHGTNTYNRTLVVHLIGGLGNQLFQYASVFAIAHRTNRDPIACISYDMRTVFSNLSMPMYTNDKCKSPIITPKSSLYLTQRNNPLYYDVETISILKESKNPHAFICCYLQNLGFFMDYEKELRAQFIIKDTLQRKAQLYLHQLLRRVAQKKNISVSSTNALRIGGKAPIIVGMHIRRGDMLRERWMAQPGPAYFNMAMDYFRKKYGPSVIFNVASDDVAWSKANVTGPDVYFTADSGAKSREDEFAIAVACNHTIISVGTFGWWMGYLTGGEVVYYKNFALKDWVKWFHPGQFFPLKWKPM